MTLLILLIAVVALTFVTWTVLYVAQLVRNDGYGRLGGPQSHRPDIFDPRYRHYGRHA